MRIGVRGLAWALSAAGAAYCVVELALRSRDLAPELPATVALAAAAALSALVAGRPDGTGPARLAVGFVLAAVLVLPAPGVLVVGLATLAVSGGGGIAGLHRNGAAPFAAAVVALALVHHAALLFGPVAGTSGARALGLAVVCFVLLHAASLVLDSAFLAASGEAPLLLLRGSLPRLAVETIAILAGWLLASAWSAGARASAGALVATVLLAQLGLRRYHRATSDLKEINDALAARVGELHTLHAIGREILSSLDPTRVFDIVERECRKILDVDAFSIATVDPDSGEIRVTTRETPGGPTEEEVRPLGEGLASWVVTEKRGVRIDDLRENPENLPFRPDVGAPGLRSALAAPLLVEDRAVGVLAIQSARPAAYDDHLLGVLTTIAQQAAVALENARHYQMATVDSLTGLFLRDYFFRRLEEEYRRSCRYDARFAILMLDLDGFKGLNDRHGHLAGDRYLRAFGSALRSRLRGADLACRYGGDEFCLLLPETDLEGARAIAERLRSAVARLVIEFEGAAVRTTASIGLAAFPEHDAGALRALLLRADQALYAAKRAGRDRVVPFAA